MSWWRVRQRSSLLKRGASSPEQPFTLISVVLASSARFLRLSRTFKNPTPHLELLSAKVKAHYWVLLMISAGLQTADGIICSPKIWFLVIKPLSCESRCRPSCDRVKNRPLQRADKRPQPARPPAPWWWDPAACYYHNPADLLRHELQTVNTHFLLLQTHSLWEKTTLKSGRRFHHHHRLINVVELMQKLPTNKKHITDGSVSHHRCSGDVTTGASHGGSAAAVWVCGSF